MIAKTNRNPVPFANIPIGGRFRDEDGQVWVRIMDRADGSNAAMENELADKAVYRRRISVSYARGKLLGQPVFDGRDMPRTSTMRDSSSTHYWGIMEFGLEHFHPGDEVFSAAIGKPAFDRAFRFSAVAGGFDGR